MSIFGVFFRLVFGSIFGAKGDPLGSNFGDFFLIFGVLFGYLVFDAFLVPFREPKIVEICGVLMEGISKMHFRPLSKMSPK